MRHVRMFAVTGVVALATVAWAQQEGQVRPEGQKDQQAMTGMKGPKPDAVVTDRTQTRFTVKSVDQQSREVVLVGPDGKERKYTASDKVRRFDQIKPGDVVDATAITRVGLFVHSPGAKPAAPEQEVIAEATPGTKPGIVVATIDQMTVDIVSVNQEQHTITFRGPKGNELTAKAAPETNISGIKAGDQVTVRVTEALAIVTKAPEDVARPAGEELK